jgi:FKBP-type peptidyl-prolyl cis-trans isomerase
MNTPRWVAVLSVVVCMGCASGGGAAGDGAVAGRQGEVERTVFAEELNIVLPEMTRSSAGIYYREIEEGTGVPASPGREVYVTYIAYLADGTEVDRTAPGARPLLFKVGEGIVIRGWDLGVRGMRTGGTRQLVVPSRYAYGNRAVGNVPPNAVMVFVIRLDRVR